MKNADARSLIRRLRSNGVKVFLRNDQVHFRNFDEVSNDLKLRVVEHGKAMKAVLIEEEKVREARRTISLNREKTVVKDIPESEL